MQPTELTAAGVAEACDRAGAYIDERVCYHPAGRLGRPRGSPLGLTAVAARPELAETALDSRAAAAVLGWPADVFLSFSGGFADARGGVAPHFDAWPPGEATAAYRAGFRLAGELHRLRPDLFEP